MRRAANGVREGVREREIEKRASERLLGESGGGLIIDRNKRVRGRGVREAETSRNAVIPIGLSRI